MQRQYLSRINTLLVWVSSWDLVRMRTTVKSLSEKSFVVLNDGLLHQHILSTVLDIVLEEFIGLKLVELS